MSVTESAEALIDVGASAPLRVPAGARVLLRFGVVERLVVAQSLLPRHVHLMVVAGHGPDRAHVTGGAVDLSCLRADDDEPPVLPCCRCARPPAAPGDRLPALTGALTAAGLVNDVQRWWHWSYGDPSWRLATGAPHVRYGPVAGF